MRHSSDRLLWIYQKLQIYSRRRVTSTQTTSTTNHSKSVNLKATKATNDDSTNTKTVDSASSSSTDNVLQDSNASPGVSSSNLSAPTLHHYSTAEVMQALDILEYDKYDGTLSFKKLIKNVHLTQRMANAGWKSRSDDSWDSLYVFMNHKF